VDPVQQTTHIDVDHAVPLLDEPGVETRQRHHPRVRDEHVEAPVPCHRAVDRLPHGVAVGDVERARLE
jgi:hypothetical protein